MPLYRRTFYTGLDKIRVDTDHDAIKVGDRADRIPLYGEKRTSPDGNVQYVVGGVDGDQPIDIAIRTEV